MCFLIMPLAVTSEGDYVRNDLCKIYKMVNLQVKNYLFY